MYVDSCPLCTVLDGACMAMVLYSYAVWFNTGTVYQKKKTTPCWGALLYYCLCPLLPLFKLETILVWVVMPLLVL